MQRATCKSKCFGIKVTGFRAPSEDWGGTEAGKLHCAAGAGKPEIVANDIMWVWIAIRQLVHVAMSNLG
eukprot:4262792-Amphidinium_carterae.1